MKTFRIVAGILALLTIVFFAIALILPPIMNDQSAFLELIFTGVGIPIFVLNMWAWTAPELIDVLFFGKEIA